MAAIENVDLWLNHKDSTYRHCQSVILIFIDTGLWIADSGKRTFVYFLLFLVNLVK